MKQFYSIATAATSEPLTYAQACDQLRVDSDADETYITALISVARKYVEDVTGRVCMEQEQVLKCDTLGCLYGKYTMWVGNGYVMPIYRSPIVSVDAVKYYKSGESNLTTMPDTDYRVIIADGVSYVHFFQNFPSLELRPDALQIEFTAGVDDADNVDPMLLHAIRLMIAHLYENRVPVGSKVDDVPYTLRTFLENLKVGGSV